MKFKFFAKFFWKFSMKCHKSFLKKYNPPKCIYLKITTNLVGKNWLKFSQQKWLVSEVLRNGHKKCGYFLHTEVYLI